MYTVTNKKSPHYGKKGKLVQEIKEEDIFLIYFKEDESLCQFKRNELKSCTNVNSKRKNHSKSNTPKSRKDFYYMITRRETTRKQIVDSIKELQKTNMFNIQEKEHAQDEGIEESTFFDFIRDLQNSPYDIINEIRSLRDKGYIEFLLPNNSYNPKPQNLEKRKNSKTKKNVIKIAN